MSKNVIAEIKIEKMSTLETLSKNIAQDLRDLYYENFGTLGDHESKGTHFHVVRGYEERILFFKRSVIETLLCLKQTETNGRKDVKAYISDEIVEPTLRKHREVYIKENGIGYFTIRKDSKGFKIRGIGFS